MDRKIYEDYVSNICDLIYMRSQPNVISKNNVCDVFNAATDNRPVVPGYWMTDAMENWGKKFNYTLMFHTNKHGKRKNIVLVRNDLI